jgi:hypothetical protein
VTDLPPFVRPLVTPGLIDAKVLELDPEVQAQLNQALERMRRARDAAWASGQNYPLL